MNSYRWKLGLCVSVAVLLAAVGLQAQEAASSSIGNAQRQRQRSARFLRQRGIGAAPIGRLKSERGAARMLAEARARHHALAATRLDPVQQTGPTSLNAPWQAVGPAQVTTAEYGAVTGRVSSVAVDSSDATGNTVYVGTTGGGVWKSTNAAGSVGAVMFMPLTDTLSAFAATDVASLSIGAVSVQPGGTGVVLAGTGDPNDATDSYYGAGILRSADGGVTWTLISNAVDTANGLSVHFTFTGNSFAGFAWSAVNPNLVVAAVSQAAQGLEVNAGTAATSMMGIYYSQDAGQSWQMASIADSVSNIVQSDQVTFLTRGNAVTSVAWNPMRQMFYAAVRFHGYYQSADGMNWMRMPNQPGTNLTTLYCPTNTGSTGSPACPIFRGALAVQPATGDLYALTVDENNRDQGLWQDLCNLNSGACSSSAVMFANQVAATALEAGNGDTTIPQADYNLYLAAVPSQQDTLLFAGTEDVYQCSLANSCAWRNTTHATSCASARVAAAQHAMDATLGAQGLLYFGNDGGLWRSTDAVNQQAAQCSADDATHYQNLNGGLGSLAEVENLADDATNAGNMMASLGALGTAAPQGASAVWPQVLDGEGNYAAIDPASPVNWYATSEFGVSISRCTAGSGCDVAGFGQPVIGDTQVAGDGDQQTIPAPWILDPQDSANVILGTCRVWRGPGTGGAGWSNGNLLSGMLDGDQGPYCNGNAEVRALAASGSATDAAGAPERIYAGMAGLLDGGGTVPGHIYTAAVTSSSGEATAWTDLFHSPVANGGSGNTQFNPGGFDISSIYVDPHDPTGQTVYATVQGFSGNGINAAIVYGSTDGGADWSNMSSNLPSAPANSIVVDPNDANTVYVALDTGVYITRNVSSCAALYASCWSVFGTSLPNAPVVQLQAFNEGSTSVLRAATYGRGIWQIGLVTAGTAMTTATALPAQLTFPSQQVQTESAAQTVAVKNTGTITFNVSQISITGDFAETDNCAAGVMPGESCNVQVTFTPAQTGQRTGTLTLYGNVPGGQVTVALSGTGVPGAAVVLSPLTLTFPQTLTGLTAAAQDVTISNTGGVAAGLTSETVTGDFSIVANTCTGSLNPNSGCTLSISFTPTASGSRTGVLTVVDSAGDQLTAHLSGAGQSVATDVLSPTSLSFAAQIVGTLSPAQQVTLTNNGDQALQLITAQSSGDFNVVNSCGTSLAGHSVCAISVSYVPTKVGAETGTLTVGDVVNTVVNGAVVGVQRSQTVTLSGTALAPPGVSATPVSVNFGDYAVGGTSPAQVVTLTNNGGVALTGLHYNVTGDFTIPGGNNGCPATLAVGANCPIAMVFSPAQAGVRGGSLTVSSPDLPAPLQVALSGNGEDFALLVNGSNSATVTSGQTATFQLQIAPVNGSTGTVALGCAGAPQNATCTVNPLSLSLTGSNTASATVTIATGQSAASAAASFGGRGLQRQGWHRVEFALGMLLPVGFLAGRRRAWRSLAFVGVLASLLPIGCGLGVTAGSGGSKGPPPPNGSVTPSGAYTLTITGTAPGLSHSVQVTLTVE